MYFEKNVYMLFFRQLYVSTIFFNYISDYFSLHMLKRLFAMQKDALAYVERFINKESELFVLLISNAQIHVHIRYYYI